MLLSMREVEQHPDQLICRQCKGLCSTNPEHQCGSTDNRSLYCADLAKHCSIIFTMLVDDQAVRSVMGEILEARPAEGTVLVECSTVSPMLIEELESRAQDLGCRLLSCPVFGRPDAVRAGSALFVCAGDPTAKQQVRCSHSIACIVVARQIPSSQVGCAGERANALQNSVNYVLSHQIFTGPLIHIDLCTGCVASHIAVLACRWSPCSSTWGPACWTVARKQREGLS
jgi:hypothetical protein